MKKIIYLLSATLMFSCAESTGESQEVSNTESDRDYIAVYDFHSEHRCETCLEIEEATVGTLDKNFKTQLEDKTITFTLLNAEAEENQVLAEEYGAFGSTLAITIFKGEGKEIIDITNWAFEAVHGDDFERELTEKLNNALAKL